MRITAIVKPPVTLEGRLANAVVNFSGHTVSLVAIITDTAVGVAFNSIGRYAQSGILRDRMIPRVLTEPPDALLDDSGRIDPVAVLTCALTDEKPGATATGQRPPPAWGWADASLIPTCSNLSAGIPMAALSLRAASRRRTRRASASNRSRAWQS
jgi:hypothetical protein